MSMSIQIEDEFNWEASLSNLWEKLGGWFDAFVLALPNLLLASIIFILFWGLGRLLNKFIVRKVMRRQVRQKSIRVISRKLILGIFILTGFFIALGILNLDQALTSLLAGAGVVALTIGLALQGTLNNTFSGVILSFLPNINIGDFIETQGYRGIVEDISLRSLVLRQSDNNITVIPNSKTAEEPFTNYSITERSRIFVSCGIAYDSDLKFVKQLTVDTIAKVFKQKGEERIEFFYTEFGDSSIDFLLRFWADAKTNAQILAQKDKAIMAIKEVYDTNDIVIPFPIRTLEYLKNKDDE